MSEENTENKTEGKKSKKEERTPGARGEVGQAGPALIVRQKWHEADFERVSAPTRDNPSRRVWVAKGGARSLKKFARELAKAGDQSAKDWLANKRGAQNKGRSEANEKAAREAAMATKAARKKTKTGGGK